MRFMIFIIVDGGPQNALHPICGEGNSEQNNLTFKDISQRSCHGGFQLKPVHTACSLTPLFPCDKCQS